MFNKKLHIILLSLIAPIVVMSFYLLITRGLNLYYGLEWLVDYIALIGSLASGMFLLWKAQVSKFVYLITALCALFLGLPMMMFYSLVFVCSVFSNCL